MRVATALLVIAIIALLAMSFTITSFSVQDTDASTYVIVPMLMLPVFAFFTLKDRINPEVGRRDVMIGALIFAAFIVDVIALRYALSGMFLGLRADLLLMPIAITALVTLLFGFKNLGRFAALIVYSVLAAPIVLTPIISLAQSFTVANTFVVYSVVKVFVANVQYLPPISILANGYNIGIGQTCVSIGAFIALVLFLIPVAYLYDGEDREKFFWLVSGIVLLLVFNLLRMFFITYYWFAYGPSQVVSVIHIFIGSILFYIAVIVMLLVAGMYGLGFKARKAPKERPQTSNLAGVAVMVVFLLAYLALSSNYPRGLYISPVALTNQVPYNFSNPAMAAYVDRIANIPGYTSETFSGANSPVSETLLYNSTISPPQSILVYVSAPDSKLISTLLTNNTLLDSRIFFNDRGIVEHVYEVKTVNNTYFIYYTQIPYALPNDSSTIIGTYVLITKSVVGTGAPQCSDYDPLYTFIYNLPNVRTNATAQDELGRAYCIGETLAWYNET